MSSRIGTSSSPPHGTGPQWVAALPGALHDDATLTYELPHAIALASQASGGGSEAAQELAIGVAPEFRAPLKRIVGDVTIHRCPPSIGFGKDANTVRVKPTAVGSTTPGTEASAGEQVDVNREGEGGHDISRLSFGVVQDATGKPVSGSED